MNRADERRSLLQAVLDAPDDDAVRLVYADWLEEYGDSRDDATIITAIRHGLENPVVPYSCEGDGDVGLFCGDDYGYCQTCDLARLRGLPYEFLGRGSKYVIRRGFVEELRAPLYLLLEFGPEILRRHPVTKMMATDKEPDQCSNWYFYPSPRHPKHTIPIELWDVHVPPGHSHGRSHYSKESAISWLSSAILTYCRKKSCKVTR